MSIRKKKEKFLNRILSSPFLTKINSDCFHREIKQINIYQSLKKITSSIDEKIFPFWQTSGLLVVA